jgi:hypothetical protein
MHITRIKLKDGDIIEGYIEKWHPVEGYLTLGGLTEQLKFEDMESAITYDERTGVIRDEDGKIVGTKIEDVDELQRAKDYIREFIDMED